jgi:hypothetical protein
MKPEARVYFFEPLGYLNCVINQKVKKIGETGFTVLNFSRRNHNVDRHKN